MTDPTIGMCMLKEGRCQLCDDTWYVGGGWDGSCRLAEEDLSEKLWKMVWKMVSADVCLLKGYPRDAYDQIK